MNSRRWRQLLIRAGILTTPVIVLYVAQFTSDLEAGNFSGLIHSDMAVYVANARQYVEAPGSLFYANPYDWDGPAIYFQPHIWLLGQVLRSGIEPALALALMGFAATLGAMIVLQLVLARYLFAEDETPAFWVVLLAAWGGGVLTLAHLLGGPWLDPGDGFWFLNLGRNFVYPTEAVYHLITLFLFLWVLRRRYRLAFLGGLFLAVTHPFTGAQYAAILLAWAGSERLLALLASKRDEATRARRIGWPDVVLAGLPVVFVVGYYLVYLPSFPSHAALVEQWEHDWSLSWASSLAAYGPVGAFAGHRILANRHTFGAFERFLLWAAVLSFGLAHHDLLIDPIQPLHFTRGHIWFPLFLLGLPSILALVRSAGDISRRTRLRVLTLLLFVGLYDNAAFLIYHSLTPTGLYITHENRSLLDYVSTREDRPVMLSWELMPSYLIATYSGVRPFVSHWGNTPRYEEKLALGNEMFETGNVPPELAGQCLIVPVPVGDRPPQLEGEAWEAFAIQDWIIHERAGAGCPVPASSR